MCRGCMRNKTKFWAGQLGKSFYGYSQRDCVVFGLSWFSHSLCGFRCFIVVVIVLYCLKLEMA